MKPNTLPFVPAAASASRQSRHLPWWHHSVIYQVYPWSFQDGNDDGIGDLRGIAARLPYIAALGVDAVWISPFFKSPMRDFGYDVSDYREVDPMFGTLTDFDALLDDAHRLGLKVLIDLVMSHTSDQHPWFDESRRSRTNAKADWYVWADAKPDGAPPNNWLSLFGGVAWQWDTRREQYFLHNFLTSQPDLNFHNPEVQDQMLDIARFWLERGVDGFRLDVVNFYMHDLMLRDNPPMPPGRFATGVPHNNPYARQRHLYDKSRPENLQFISRLRALLDVYGDRVAIGEIGDDEQYPTLSAYTAGNDRLHMAYVFTLLTASCDVAYLYEVLRDYLHNSDNAHVCWSLGNHDVVRVVTRWAALGGTPEERVRFCCAFLLSLPGALCLFQGEELGLPEAEIPFALLRDPYGKEMWPEYKGRDGCRTPMPWHNVAGGGFSEQMPWLPVPLAHQPLAVDEQLYDVRSPLNFYRHMIGWRAHQPALASTGMALCDRHEQLLIFDRFVRPSESREFRERGIVPDASSFAWMRCVFNFSHQEVEMQLPRGLSKLESPHDGAWPFTRLCDKANCLLLPPLGWTFLIKEGGAAVANAET